MKKNKLSEVEVLQKKADALLDNPIIITLDITPKNWYQRLLMWFKIKPSQKIYKVTGATLRTMIKVSNLLLNIDYEPMPEEGKGQLDWAYKGIVANGELSVKIIATAIHNHNSDYPGDLEDNILDGMDAKLHQKAAFNIISKLDVFTFMNTITSLRTINILKEVSLQPAEIIAPEKTISGEELEILSSIFASPSPS